MTSISLQLEKIAKGLEHVREKDRVVISANRGFSLVVKTSLIDRILSFFLCFFSKPFRDANRDTYKYFFDVFGQKRVYEISQRYNLNLEAKYKKGMNLTQRDVQWLFIGASDVRSEDIRELFEEIKAKNGASLRSLDSAASASLYSQFRDKHSVSELNKSDLDEMYKILVPFAKLEHIFLMKVPNVTALSVRDDTLKGRANRVFLIEQMRRDPNFDEMRWQMRFCKRVADENLAKGTIIPHPSGYYEHHDLIQGGGAYKLLLRPFNSKLRLSPLICYLSTRAAGLSYDSFLSRKESLQKNIGVNGVKETFEKTQQYLTDTSKGFVASPYEKVQLIGMSLGGAQASRDACLFLDRVEKLTTICAPGIDSLTCKQYASVTKSNYTPMEIHHIVEKDDVVPDLGDAHLGLGCDPEKVKVRHTTFIPISPETNPVAQFPYLPHRAAAPEALKEMFYKLFIVSLMNSHSRETTAQNHFSYEISSDKGMRDRVDEILNNAANPLRGRWEQVRQQIALGENDEFFNFWSEKRKKIV